MKKSRSISCIRKFQPSGENPTCTRPPPSPLVLPPPSSPRNKVSSCSPGNSRSICFTSQSLVPLLFYFLARACINLQVCCVSARTPVKRPTNGRPCETCPVRISSRCPLYWRSALQQMKRQKRKREMLLGLSFLMASRWIKRRGKEVWICREVFFVINLQSLWLSNYEHRP